MFKVFIIQQSYFPHSKSETIYIVHNLQLTQEVNVKVCSRFQQPTRNLRTVLYFLELSNKKKLYYTFLLNDNFFKIFLYRSLLICLCCGLDIFLLVFQKALSFPNEIVLVIYRVRVIMLIHMQNRTYLVTNAPFILPFK